MPRGRPFQPGNQFGRGRPRGSRNKRSRATQQLLHEYGEPLVRKAMAEALKGDNPLLRTFLSYLLPRWKDAPVPMGPLPAGTVADVAGSLDGIFQKVGSGELSAQDGRLVAHLLAAKLSVIFKTEIESTIFKL
jgi:hypothetical protein